MPHRAGVGAIFGIVSEDGIVKENSPVLLIDPRRDADGVQRILGRQLTRADGGFEFAGLDTSYTDYMLLATDEDGVEPKNALVQDRVQPIPAYSGLDMFGDWAIRARRMGSVSMMLGYPVEESPDHTAFGPFCRPIDGVRNGTPGLIASDLVYADPPNMPLAGTQLANSSYFIGARHAPRPQDGWTMELLVDLDSVAAHTSTTIFYFFAPISDNSQGSGVLNWVRMSHGYSGFNSSWSGRVDITNTKQLSIYGGDLVSNSNAYSASTLLSTVDLSAYSGLQHITVVYYSAAYARTFVSGAVVQNDAHAHTHAVRYTGIYRPIFVVHDPATGSEEPRSTPIKLVAANLITRPLADSEVAELHTSLYGSGLTPLCTGYSKALVEHLPSMYYKCNDYHPDTHASLTEFHCPDLDSAWTLDVQGTTSLVDNTEVSPIAGHNTILLDAASGNYFTGGYAGVFGLPFDDQFTLTFWVKFSDLVPSSTEELIKFRQRGLGSSVNGYTDWLNVQRLTSGLMRFGMIVSGAYQTYDFVNYTPPQNEWLQITLVGNATASPATFKLYAGTSLASPTEVDSIDIGPAATFTTYKDFHTETYDNTIYNLYGSIVSLLQDFSGSFCEFALLPKALTAQEIADLWASKDVV